MAKLPKMGSGEEEHVGNTGEVMEPAPIAESPTQRKQGTDDKDPLGLFRDPSEVIEQALSCIKNKPKGMHGELSTGQRLALLKLDAALVLLRV